MKAIFVEVKFRIMDDSNDLYDQILPSSKIEKKTRYLPI